jgi:hypothetical protein
MPEVAIICDERDLRVDAGLRDETVSEDALVTFRLQRGAE